MKRFCPCLTALVLVFATSAKAQAQISTPHTISLPSVRSLDGRWPTDFEAIAGEPPSPPHPRGTVVLIESATSDPQPTLSEWDLMSGQNLRTVALPLAPHLIRVGIVRAGSRIHVIAYTKLDGDLFYFRFTPTLQLEAQERLGTTGGISMATDGSIVAILWEGTREGAGNIVGWHLVTLDAGGRHLGAAMIFKDSMFGGKRDMAVVNRQVFVLLNNGRYALPPLLRFSEYACFQQAYGPFHNTPDPQTTLVPWAGRLLAIDGCYLVELVGDLLFTGRDQHLPPHKRVDPWCPDFAVDSDAAGRLVTSDGDVLSASLVLERHFVPYDGFGQTPLWVGSIPVLLSADLVKNGRLWLTWSD